MKTLLTVLTLLSLTSSALAQNGGNYDELIKQSRKARTTSTIFVVVGPVIAAGGVGTLLYGVLANAFEEPGSHYDPVTGYSVPNERKKHTAEIVAGAAGTLVGIGLALTSIHFSSKASELKREARKTKLKTSTDRISIPGFQNGFANSKARQFKVSLVISL